MDTPDATRRTTETLRWTCMPCVLGRVLVATSNLGVCAIFLGDDAAALLADLRRRFPRVSLQPGDDRCQAWARAVVALIEDSRQTTNLPLDIRGTPFQQRVWALLRTIPPGHTLSYGDIARRLGCPRSTRAVAQACGANPLSVAIPCHRVVAADGRLTGYRWGLERKRALLKNEAGA